MSVRTRSTSLLVAALIVSGCSSTPAAPTTSTTAPPARDTKEVARMLVAAAMIKPDDKVLVAGDVRDAGLLRDISIETMKVGGQPLATIGDDEFTRRSYTDVPATYDSQPQTFALGLTGLLDAQITVDVGESDSVLSGVAPARIAARSVAGLPVTQLALKRNIRSVALGNGLYPTATLAARLGKPLAEVTDAFWKAVTVSPDTLQARGDILKAKLTGAKTVTLTAANGTNITFSCAGAKASISNGALNDAKVKQGGFAVQTWLPAGELLTSLSTGTGDGKIVIDKSIIQGTTVTGLTLTFAKGHLTDATATSGVEAFKALYDAAKSGKDLLAYIDLGLNPAITFPTNTGRVIWMAAGNVTIGMGDNTSWGGTNVSDFGFAGAVSGATLAVDGVKVIDKGTLVLK